MLSSTEPKMTLTVLASSSKLAGQGVCEIIFYVPQRVSNNWVLKFHETYLGIASLSNTPIIKFPVFDLLIIPTSTHKCWF